MTNFIPIFPLGIVVYPGEDLNLHIFEPRYKQLINECHAGKKPFGIPTVIENKVHKCAIVNYPDNYEMENPEMMRKVMKSIRDLHQLLKVDKSFIIEDDQL